MSSTTEFVPPRAKIEITEHAFNRARDRLGLTKAAVEFAAPRAKRVDAYKDGLRLWRIDKGWLAVHEIFLEGGQHFRAVVVTAIDDSMLAGWAPRSPAAYTPPKRGRPPQRSRRSSSWWAAA